LLSDGADTEDLCQSLGKLVEINTELFFKKVEIMYKKFNSKKDIDILYSCMLAALGYEYVDDFKKQQDKLKQRLEILKKYKKKQEHQEHIDIINKGIKFLEDEIKKLNNIIKNIE